MKKLYFLLLVLALGSCAQQTAPESQVYEATFGKAYVFDKDSTEHGEHYVEYTLHAVITVNGDKTLTEVQVPKRLYEHYHVGDSIPSIVY